AALDNVSPAARRMIHAWLHGEMLPAPATAPVADDAVVAVPARTRPRPAERRTFGRAGFDVAPLVISGAYDPSPRALAIAADAGVDAYFWEPGYDALTKHLRGRAGRVIAGSYHADARSIEA